MGLVMNYKNNIEKYNIDFKKISPNIVQITGSIPKRTTGFYLSRKDEDDRWDYTEYNTIYKELQNGFQFSNDGSVYVEPEPIPEPEPYVPTIEEVKYAKVQEMNDMQQAVITLGFDATLTDGETRHFKLSDKDQISILGLQLETARGREYIPWHIDDESVSCQFYSNEDMRIITDMALATVTFHVTYFRDLRIWINSMNTKEEIEAIYYGISIPEAYQGEVLQQLYAQMEE